MKIVDVCAFYAPHGGGVRTYIDRKLEIGSGLGQEIAIIVPGPEDRVEERAAGGRLIHVASPKLVFDRRYRYFENGAAVHRILDAEQPDLVEASSPWRTASIVAEWRGTAPRSLIMHADPLAAYAYRWFGRITSRKAIDRGFDMFWQHLRRTSRCFDTVVSANASLAGRLRAGGVSNVVTIPMGVDPDTFSPSLRSAAVRAELLARCGLGVEATLLLGVGRLSAEKRWPLVVDAALAAGRTRPVGLVILGDGRDRGKLIRHIGGNPHVHLLAPIRDRGLFARVLASGDALVHGCEAETFGLAAAEAAASGVPLLVPDEGGASDFVDSETGEKFAAGSAASAAQALERLLARDRHALTAAAVSRARQSPTIDDHFIRLFGTYAALARALREAA